MPRGFEAIVPEGPLVPGTENGVRDLLFAQAAGGVAIQAHSWNGLGERSVPLAVTRDEETEEATCGDKVTCAATCWDCPTQPPECNITD